MGTGGDGGGGGPVDVADSAPLPGVVCQPGPSRRRPDRGVAQVGEDPVPSGTGWTDGPGAATVCARSPPAAGHRRAAAWGNGGIRDSGPDPVGGYRFRAADQLPSGPAGRAGPHHLVHQWSGDRPGAHRGTRTVALRWPATGGQRRGVREDEATGASDPGSGLGNHALGGIQRGGAGPGAGDSGGRQRNRPLRRRPGSQPWWPGCLVAGDHAAVPARSGEAAAGNAGAGPGAG